MSEEGRSLDHIAYASFHRVEAVIGARFPGINKRVGDFNFVRHYGAEGE